MLFFAETGAVWRNGCGATGVAEWYVRQANPVDRIVVGRGGAGPDRCCTKTTYTSVASADGPRPLRKKRIEHVDPLGNHTVGRIFAGLVDAAAGDALT